MNSRDYWAKREAEALKHYISDEKEYSKQLQRIYSDMLVSINEQINGFYGKYAGKEGITLAEAKKRVSKLDIAAYERKAEKYVKEKNFSAKANEEMRLYNATMKINRLEMLKANIGLEMIAGHDELEKFMGDILKGRTEEELQRQAGILGKTILNNAQKANAIVNGSFKAAKVGDRSTFSDRIWQYQDLMRENLGTLLQTGLIQGKNPRAIAKDLRKYWYGNDPKTGGGATYCMERLLRTELARVQTEAQKQSFIRNGFSQYTFITNHGCCSICQGLDGKHFDIADMMPGDNAPPVHPNCRCSVAAYEDDAEYEAWLDYLDKGGTTAEWNATGKTEWEKAKPQKMAANSGSQNKWDDALPRSVTKEEKAEIINYAKSKGVNIVDLSKFDGDTSLLKAEIDALEKLISEYALNNKKITIAVSNSLPDSDFASTKGNTITFNAKALRNRKVTERNINAIKGKFASSFVEDIVVHEFGHIVSSMKGNKGIEISQQAYYNVNGKKLEIKETLEFLGKEISQYSIEYRENLDGVKRKFDARKYQEIISEILAKHNSNPDEFTTEFIKLLKGA